MMWSVYIRRGKVFVPSQSKTEAGFYVSGNPVYIVDAADVEGIKQSIIQVIDRGCPVIPTPSVKQLEKWAVLQCAGVASIATFEKGASCWTIHKDATSFRFGSVKKISPRGWETEPDTPHLLSNNLPSDVIAEEIAKAISIVAAQVTK
jgi:hypothetical protein